jgi:hypothetical protein
MSAEAVTEYFVVLTMSKPCSDGHVQNTSRGLVRVGPGDTRAEVYEWALRNAPESVRGGSVIFFSAEPNQLGGEAR